MAKKNEVEKATAAKGTKTGKSAKSEKAKAPEPKAQAQKKRVSQRKPTRAAGKAGTTFTLEAPQAAQVSVAGCFNGWDPAANPLERNEAGTWSCTMAIEPGEHEYRFVVDGVWCDDPVNPARRWNDFGTQNCVLVV